MTRTAEPPKAFVRIDPRRSSRTLAKVIFDAEMPEQFVRTIPAQSLFVAIRQNGLTSSADLISIVSIEQCRLLLDFDVWERDRLSEERLWEWLGLTDDSGDFELLQKILKSMDLKLISLLIQRYLEVVTFDDGNDTPPGEGFYTPDKGHTWLHINIPDATRHFLLARFLALIFETSAELFYQLLSVPSVATDSVLEEESYQERVKRLEAEGVPEEEYAASLVAPVKLATVKKELTKSAQRAAVEGIRAIEPLIYDTPCGETLRELLDAGGEQLEEELTLLINAAVVRFAVDFADTPQLMDLVTRVKGAVIIGLEVARASTPKLAVDAAYQALGLSKLFGLGFQALLDLRIQVIKITEAQLQALESDAAAFSIVAGLREVFPHMPQFVQSDGALAEENGKLVPGFKAIESLEEISILRKLIEPVLK